MNPTTKKKTTLVISREHLQIRFYILRACIRAGKKDGWSPRELQNFCNECIGILDYDEMLVRVKERFDIHVLSRV